MTEFAFDIALLVLLTARLCRLAVVDHLAEWWIQEPLKKWANVRNPDGYPATWQQKLWTGTTCCFCIGFWIACATLTSLYYAGGPGDAATLWRYIAGAFALNYVSGHLNKRLD